METIFSILQIFMAKYHWDNALYSTEIEELDDTGK